MQSPYYQNWKELQAGILIKADEMNDSAVSDISKKAEKYLKLSDKQAYRMAEFADSNNLLTVEDDQSLNWLN